MKLASAVGRRDADVRDPFSYTDSSGQSDCRTTTDTNNTVSAGYTGWHVDNGGAENTTVEVRDDGLDFAGEG